MCAVLLDVAEAVYGNIYLNSLAKLRDENSTALEISLAADFADRVELRRTSAVRIAPAYLRALAGDCAAPCHSRRMVAYILLNMQLGLAESIFTVIVLILSVIIHEVSHGYAAYSLGDPTAKIAGRLTLNPLKHIDPIGSVLIPALLVLTGAGVLFGWAKPVPYNPYNLKNQRWGEAIVAVAGSASNILLAVVFGLIARFAAADPSLATFAQLAGTVAFVNLFLGLFNLLPIPPMDGYTVLRGILPYKLSYGFRQFEDRVRSLGTTGIFAILLIFVLFLSGPFFSLVSWVFGLLVGQ